MSSYWIEKEVRNARQAMEISTSLMLQGMVGLAQLNVEIAAQHAKQAATYAFFIHPDMRSRDHVPNR